MLKIRGVTRHFGATAAVNGVDLAIAPGQMVGVIGRSGAGKSTLLRLINRLIEPSAGSIESEGQDITALRGQALRDWRQSAAMIFQQFNLVPRLDVLTNILLGCLNDHSTLSSLFMRFSDDERVAAIRTMCRLDLVAQALQRVETLSGGQMQRVAIARALMQRPRLVLADEPIASLDPTNSTVVMDALRAINREDGITVICNLHALEIAHRYCDRIVGMAGGRVVFDDVPAALSRAAIAAIYGQDQVASDVDQARIACPDTREPIEAAA